MVKATEIAMVLVHVLRRNVVVTAAFFALTGTAFADSDDNVAGRLSSHGGLSSSAAKKLVGKVNVRMAKAADATAGANDPMRAAVSLALFQTPQPPNSMAAAKVRLRLYAGLNEWALEAIFAPQPGVVAGCVREIGATTSECEALVAAAAKSSVAQIRSVAGGSAAPAAAPAFAGQAPAAAGGGRFSRFNSGYQGAPQYRAPQQGYPQQYQAAPQYRAPQGYPQQYQAAPQYRAPQQGYSQQYQAAPRYQAPAQNYQRPAPQAYQRPMPQQQAYQRPAAPAYVAPAAPPPPPQPVVSAAEQQSRKDAYKAQREAYIARKKAEFEQRRQKMNSVHQADAAEAPPREGEGVPAGHSIHTAAPAPAKAPAKAAAAAAAEPEPEADEPSDAVASKASEKPALDNDFLDGLLEDPLAKKKK